jgi:hypothetical protein
MVSPYHAVFSGKVHTMSRRTYTPFDSLAKVIRAAVTVIEYIAPDSITTLSKGDSELELRN